MSVPPGPLVADTNVLSYVFNDAPLAAAYRPRLRGRQVAVSFQTLAELRFGAVRKGWGTRRQAALEQFLAPFAVVYPNDAICSRWAALRAEVEQAGRHIDRADAWIAAVALELGLPLLTYNRKDLGAVKGLTVVSEAL